VAKYLLKYLPILLILLTVLSALPQVQASPASAAQIKNSEMIWSTQVPWLASNGAPHNFQYFEEIASYGYNAIILCVPWGEIEVGPNQFNFTLLDTYVNYTRKLNLGVIFALLYGVSCSSGDPNPEPQFLLKNGEMEVNPNGQEDSPAYLSWWNATDRSYFFGFVKAVIERYNSYPNVRGYLINYGWLDDDWGPAVNGMPMGYSASDIKEYATVYLPSIYKNITSLNKAWGTDYSSFSQVNTPGGDYQDFRIWSINVTYSYIYSMARNLTRKELFLYWGGSPDDAYAIQFPYIYFSLAKKYNVTIILDDADNLEFAQDFSGLARQYGVSLMMEWTPSEGIGNKAYYAYYLSHPALAYPYLRGEDYFVFIRGGGAWPTFSLNSMAIRIYSLINGTYLNDSQDVLPILANVYVVKDGPVSYAVLSDYVVVLGSQTASLNLTALGYSPALNYSVLNFNTGKLMPSSSFVVNFHGLSGTIFLGVFPTHLNSSLILRYAGSDYNSTINASEVRVTGYSSQPGRLLTIVSSNSFSAGLISYEVGVEEEPVGKGNFSLTVTMPPLVNGSYSISGYLFEGNTVVGAYSLPFSIGAVKPEAPGQAAEQLWLPLAALLVALALASFGLISRRKKMENKTTGNELALKTEKESVSAEIKLKLTRGDGLKLLTYLKENALTSGEAKGRFRVREGPALDPSALSLTAKLSFPPYELENEQQVRITIQESGGAYYPTFEVKRISGDPSRWQAMAKRFLRQLADFVKEWARGSQNPKVSG